jgi:hypothetical protein
MSEQLSPLGFHTLFRLREAKKKKSTLPKALPSCSATGALRHSFAAARSASSNCIIVMRSTSSPTLYFVYIGLCVAWIARSFEQSLFTPFCSFLSVTAAVSATSEKKKMDAELFFNCPNFQWHNRVDNTCHTSRPENVDALFTDVRLTAALPDPSFSDNGG